MTFFFQCVAVLAIIIFFYWKMTKDRKARSEKHSHFGTELGSKDCVSGGTAMSQDTESGTQEVNGFGKSISQGEKVRRSFLLRPGDQLDYSQLTIFPETHDFEFEGYRELGHSWDGASIQLTPENRVECINLRNAPAGFDGLVLDMSSSEALSLHPDLTIVAPNYDEPPPEDLVFYRAERADKGYELLLTTSNDRVVSIALASPGCVRRQNIWHNSRHRLAECEPRLGLMFRRRACGVASADVRVSFA